MTIILPGNQQHRHTREVAVPARLTRESFCPTYWQSASAISPRHELS